MRDKKMTSLPQQLPGLYDHLRVKDWPFSVVPRPELCTYIAGRPQLDADIKELIRNLSRRDTSSVHVFWSWFGAGKTHSLYYLANCVRQLNAESAPFQLSPVYTEFPRASRGFVDLYKGFTASIDLTTVGEAFLELQTSPRPDSYYDRLLSTNPDLATALRVISTGSPQEQITASRWLRGDMVPLADYRNIGISQRIATSDTAIRILASIVNLLAAAERSKGKRGHRLIWSIDELQRIASAAKSARMDINAGLHSLFNSCPTGLSLVLSFSGQPNPDRLPPWFGSELKDRMGVTKVMIMPPLQRTEALQFVKDVLSHFRIPDYSNSSPLYPFTEEACDEILNYVGNQGHLRPRFIMDAFNAVLEKADGDIEAGQLTAIGRAFAKSVLDQHVILADEAETH